MKWPITTLKKATASAVNVSVVFTATSPIYYFAGVDWWRGSCLVLFFGYNLLLRRRCLGQYFARTYQDEPTSVAYAALYTASTATLLFWLWLPLDLALANGLMLQLPCLMIWGNTPHGLLARRKTMSEMEHLWESIAMRGECPDCHKTSLARNGSYVHCRLCRSMFFVDNMLITRMPTTDKKSPAAYLRRDLPLESLLWFR